MNYNKEFWSMPLMLISGILFPMAGAWTGLLVFGINGWGAVIIFLISGVIGFIGLSYLWSKVKYQGVSVSIESDKESDKQ